MTWFDLFLFLWLLVVAGAAILCPILLWEILHWTKRSTEVLEDRFKDQGK